MKTRYILIAILLSCYSLIAQKEISESSNPYVLGNYQEYIDSIKEIKSLKDDKIAIKVAENKTYLVTIYTANENEIIGKLDEKETVLSLYTDEKGTHGFFIVSAENNIVYKYKTNKEGILEVFPTDINKVICHGYHTEINSIPKSEGLNEFNKNEVISNLVNVNPYELESRPGASNIIMVDMDGYQLPSGTSWNNGYSYDASPVGWSDDKLKLVWAEIAQYYAPFDVNVTTKEALWSSVSQGHRQRVVITSSNSFSSGDGVAYVGSFDGQDRVCWMWMNNSYSTKNVGGIATHEVGHTLGLYHQGSYSSSYFTGNSDPSHDGWVPIMGSVTRKPIIQWSKSEFNGATADQDDLSKITQRISYNVDDHSNSITGASNLNVDVNGNVDANNNLGLITNRTDVDYFKFTALAGELNLTIKPCPLNNSGVISRSNLDLIVELYNDGGTLIATAESGHKDLLDGAVFNVNLNSSGTYYIKVDGYGTGDPTTGYSDYGSIGPYSISGTLPTETLGINEYETSTISIYPNPSKGSVFVEGINNLEEYVLINSLGQVVREGKLNGLVKEKIDFHKVQKGCYILKVKSNSQYLKRTIVLY